MLPTVWVVVVVLVAVLLSMWVTFTLTRLDRLHARVDAARATLDAQLVRRAAALLRLAESTGRPAAAAVAQEALGISVRPDAVGATGGLDGREAAENAVGRVVREVAHGQDAAELAESAARVQVARRFYNDAVRDTRTLRARRMPRLLRLAGRVAIPQFFDIDDTLPASDAGAAESGPDPRIPPTKDSA